MQGVHAPSPRGASTVTHVESAGETTQPALVQQRKHDMATHCPRTGSDALSSCDI